MRKILFEETVLELLYRLSPDVDYHINCITGEKLIVIKFEDRFTKYEAYFTHDAFIEFLTAFYEQVAYKLMFEGVESIYMFISEIMLHDFVNGVIPNECNDSYKLIFDGLIILHIEDCKITINPMLSDTAHNIIIDSASFIDNNHINTAHTIIDTLLI